MTRPDLVAMAEGLRGPCCSGCICDTDAHNARLDALIVECRALAAVVEAARLLAAALDAFDAMPARDEGASASEVNRLDRAIIDAQYRVADAVRALDGKED